MSWYGSLKFSHKKIYKSEFQFVFSLKNQISRFCKQHKKLLTKYSQELFAFIFLFYYLRASAVATATATVIPTMGLLPAPRKPIISTWAGTEEEPAN